MAKYLRLLAIVASATALTAASVRAATLVTPVAVLPDNGTAFCLTVNAGTAPIQVTSGIYDDAGNDVSVAKNCPTPPATLAPGATCWTLFPTAFQKMVYCRFSSSSSKVRGSLVLRDASGTYGTTVPATK
jgi:hypothetical protein